MDNFRGYLIRKLGGLTWQDHEELMEQSFERLAKKEKAAIEHARHINSCIETLNADVYASLDDLQRLDGLDHGIEILEAEIRKDLLNKLAKTMPKYVTIDKKYWTDRIQYTAHMRIFKEDGNGL